MTEERKTNNAIDALQHIKKEEEKARKIIQDARGKTAAKVIQNAYDEAKKIKERHLAQARKKAEKRKTAIIEQATQEAEKIRKKAEQEAASLKKKAEKTMSGAVSQVSEKIKHFLEKGEL